MVRKVSLDIEKEIVNQYYTATAKELGQKYGIKPNTIKGVWNRNGCVGKNSFNPNIAEFTKKYNTLQNKEVANFYKVDRHTIIHFAKKIGIYKPHIPVLTPEQEQEIINQYYTTTSTELAKRYKVSDSKISQVWMKAGLKGKTNRTYYYDEKFFENIDADEKAYWLGFIAADGCLYHSQDTRQDILSISLNIEDKSHLVKFQQALKTNKPISIGKHGSNNQFEHASFQISSNKMSQDLQNKGIYYRKTYNVSWPNIDYQFIPAYLRGYFDGDGSISKKFKSNQLHKVNVSIVGFSNNIKNIQKYLATQNIQSSIFIDKRKYHPDDQAFCSLSLTNKDNKNKFLHLIYDNATVYLDRKYILAQQFIDFFNQNSKTWTVNK